MLDCTILTEGAVNRLPGAIILKMSYGYTISPDGPDPLVELAELVVNSLFSKSCETGKWLVDIVPIRMQSLLFLRAY